MTSTKEFAITYLYFLGKLRSRCLQLKIQVNFEMIFFTMQQFNFKFVYM